MASPCATCGGDDFRTVEFCADCGEPPQRVNPNASGPFVCYHCMRGIHKDCIGAACKCSCDGPHPLAPTAYEEEARKIAVTMCCSCGSREHAQHAIVALVEKALHEQTQTRKRIGICKCGHAVTEHGQYESECLITGCQCKQSRRDVMAQNG